MEAQRSAALPVRFVGAPRCSRRGRDKGYGPRRRALWWIGGHPHVLEHPSYLRWVTDEAQHPAPGPARALQHVDLEGSLHQLGRGAILAAIDRGHLFQRKGIREDADLLDDRALVGLRIAGLMHARLEDPDIGRPALVVKLRLVDRADSGVRYWSLPDSMVSLRRLPRGRMTKSSDESRTRPPCCSICLVRSVSDCRGTMPSLLAVL